MTRAPTALPLLGLAVSLWTACATTERPPGTVQIRDSAGIELVENTAPTWPEGSGWTIAPEPAVEIGTVEAQVHRGGQIRA